MLENFHSNLDFYEVQNKIKFFKTLNEKDIQVLEEHYFVYYNKRKKQWQDFDKVSFKDFFITTIVFLIADFKFENNCDDNKIYLYIKSIFRLLSKIYDIKEIDQNNIMEAVKQIRGPYQKENFDLKSFLANPLSSPYTYSWFFAIQIGYYMAKGIMALEPNYFTYDQLNQLILLLKANENKYREYTNFVFINQ